MEQRFNYSNSRLNSHKRMFNVFTQSRIFNFLPFFFAAHIAHGPAPWTQTRSARRWMCASQNIVSHPPNTSVEIFSDMRLRVENKTSHSPSRLLRTN